MPFIEQSQHGVINRFNGDEMPVDHDPDAVREFLHVRQHVRSKNDRLAARLQIL